MGGKCRQRSQTVGSWEGAGPRPAVAMPPRVARASPRDVPTGPHGCPEFLREWLTLLPGGRTGEATQGLYAEAFWLGSERARARRHPPRPAERDPRAALPASAPSAWTRPPSAVRRARKVLRTSLNEAVAWRLTLTNPAKGVHAAGNHRGGPAVWDADQARAFLTATADDRASGEDQQRAAAGTPIAVDGHRAQTPTGTGPPGPAGGTARVGSWPPLP